jgi:hypothetical protein
MLQYAHPDDRHCLLAGMQMAAAERDQLQQRCDELTTEVAELKQDSERQVEVIRQLMERSEVGSSTHQQLAQEVGQLQQHNKTLSVNLESHAQVRAGGLCWRVCWISGCCVVLKPALLDVNTSCCLGHLGMCYMLACT